MITVNFGTVWTNSLFCIVVECSGERITLCALILYFVLLWMFWRKGHTVCTNSLFCIVVECSGERVTL